MSIVVQKYGGSSVADVPRIKLVADRVMRTKRQGHDLVVVVSAMGDTTDDLLGLAKQISPNPDRRELDMLLTAGERISMALLSMAIRDLGGDAISFTGSQSGIITNDRHVDARIIEVRPVRVQDELANGKIVVIAGYQGVSYRREVTTLGRGGSDTTAVAMAAALGAEYCEICSDVDGVYTADPRVVPEARRIATLSYEETQELAESGAKVLNAQAVEFAKEKGIAIFARATASPLPGADPSADGTVVRRHPPRQPGTVVGVASERDVLVLTTEREASIPEREGVSRAERSPQGLALMELLDEHKVAGKQLHIAGDQLTLVISRENLHAEARLREALTARFDGVVRLTDTLGAVSVVGAGINASFDNVRRGSDALLASGISIAGIATSSFRITWTIDRARLDDAVRLLHVTFIGPAGLTSQPRDPSPQPLLMDTVLTRFLRYVTYDTQSDERSTTYPSTGKQLVLLNELAKELKEIGLADAAVDRFGYVMATIPATTKKAGVPAIGFIAHVDTSPEMPGANVKPIVHRGYDGRDLVLPDDPTVVLRLADNPALAEQIGHDIVTASGTTLLGADNKAGVAEIVSAAAYLVDHPEIAHGPVRVAFTPDEEIGRGTQHFDIERFGAPCAYTMDGGRRGEIEIESFSADAMTFTFHGFNTHPGYAKGRMVNAIKVAAAFIERLPHDTLSPETTDGHDGFVHPYVIQASVERTSVRLLVRDFATSGLKEKEALLERLARQAVAAHPGSRVESAVEESYRNMREVLDRHPAIAEHAREAIRRAGLEPRTQPIRGGTDGSRLSFMGLPTPNLFAGEQNFHSRLEWVSVQDMEKAVEVIVHLCRIWEEHAP